jgi:hypothetical protein
MGKNKVKPSLGIIGVDHGGVSIYIYIHSEYIRMYSLQILNVRCNNSIMY